MVQYDFYILLVGCPIFLHCQDLRNLFSQQVCHKLAFQHKHRGFEKLFSKEVYARKHFSTLYRTDSSKLYFITTALLQFFKKRGSNVVTSFPKFHFLLTTWKSLFLGVWWFGLVLFCIRAELVFCTG